MTIWKLCIDSMRDAMTTPRLVIGEAHQKREAGAFPR